LKPSLTASVYWQSAASINCRRSPFQSSAVKTSARSLGIAADEAENGEEALRYLQQDRYDLLITDLNMPVMDGIALTREVRRFDSELPIWGLTATAQQHERERCLAAGMTMSFKPITLAQISPVSRSSQTNGAAFDEKRLAVLAQGNRGLCSRHCMMRSGKSTRFRSSPSGRTRRRLSISEISYSSPQRYCPIAGH
jgi:CheY-like chemotaxis protein